MPVPVTTPLSIRLAAPADATSIAKVHIASWQAAYRDLLSPTYLLALGNTVQRRATFIESALANGRLDAWVAERDSEIVGWSSFGSSRDDDAPPLTGELYSLYLHPQVWGQGGGRLLWQASRQALVASGHCQVTLWALDGNQRAERFYVAAGFIRQTTRPRVFEDDGIALPLIRYVQAL
ncbi:GNAT family N-acetyltransferase [Pseudomonas sp. v388]|uniref:GNAT family N-acetyltransferase n=1 Tax=Pseudomonas sp. v388 TaxID=2479849 RepID=UPI0013158789|nr:GNAT family N-acetyltransferase [Pseudomonas sp. v388]